jgi:hypothetical protein
MQFDSLRSGNMPAVPEEDGRSERDDLAEVLERRALTEDAARPDAVERRHAGGQALPRTG